jgi:RHS repeat-associated protein
MVACAETLTAEDKVKGPFAHIGLRAGDSNIPNGTTDSCWFGWQTMEERNPYGGSGSTDTPTKEYIWGTYIDECIQIHLLVPAGPQQLPLRHYYLLQDTLHRAVALTNSGGEIQEAYDTDAYGNTIIFTGPGPDNTWFTDDDTQSSYGANDIIYCGYRYDAETENYYVRNRYYSPAPGRWLTRDLIGVEGGVNLYEYAGSAPAGATDEHGTFAHGAQSATWGEIGSWAYLCPGGKFTQGIPAGLADAEASIASLITRNRGVNFKPPPPPPPKGKFSLNWAAWQNIVAAGGGKDETGGGNFMCVGSQRCYFVHSCYCCVKGVRKLVSRPKPLPPSGIVTVDGCLGGTLYFYKDPLQIWCNRKAYLHGCR